MSSVSPKLPWLVLMLAVTVGGVVGILPVRGGLTFLLACSDDAGYWQFSPRPAGAANGGSLPSAGGFCAGAVELSVDAEAVESLGVKVVKANLISETNLVRHDPVKLSRAIMEMVFRLKANSERMKLLDYYLIAEHIKELKDEDRK